MANDGREFARWLSAHLLTNTARVHKAAGVNDAEVEEYVAMPAEISESSGGETVDPPRTAHDCPDHEDNLGLDLAAVVGHCS